MAAAQNRQKEVGEKFPRRDGYAHVGESRPGHASQVEAWINKEFGDDVEASQMIDNDEGDLYRSQVVDEYIEMLDCMHDTTYSIYEEVVDVDVFFSRVDSEEFEMCYEPQLWNFN